MAGHAEMRLRHWFLRPISPPPALHTAAIAADELALSLPFRFPVHPLTRARFQPRDATRPRAVPMLPALDAGRQGVERRGILQEGRERAGRTSAPRARNAALCRNTGEHVPVRLERLEQALRPLRQQRRRRRPQFIQLRPDLERYLLRHLDHVFLLEPEMRVAEGAGGGELAPAQRRAHGGDDARHHGRVAGERKRVRQRRDLTRLQRGMSGRWAPVEQAVRGRREEGRGAAALGGRAEERDGGG